MGRPGRKKLTGDNLHRAEVLSVYKRLLKQEKVLPGGPASQRLNQLKNKWKTKYGKK
tara:strand:- start:372 stop:542 length:171 start_codon:yes stop_codon:yes gene_type:complete